MSIFESMKLTVDRGSSKEISSSAIFSWALLFCVLVSKNFLHMFLGTSILRCSFKEVLQLISLSFQDILTQPLSQGVVKYPEGMLSLTGYDS